MYKLVIAAGNQDIIQRTGQIIQNELDNIEIIKSVQSGSGILQYLEKEMPEIIVMTMNLSDCNGMELIQEIRKKRKEIYICVLGDNETVETVSELIQYKIDGYITKSSWKKDLIKTINAAIHSIQTRNEEKIEEARKRELLLEERIKLSNFGFVFSILYNNQSGAQIEHYAKIMELDEYAYILNVELNEGTKFIPDIKKKYHLIYKDLKRIIGKRKAVIGDNISNRIIIVMSVSRSELDYVKQDSDIIARGIIQSIQKKYGLKVVIGIGKVCTIKNIHTSYEEAILCLHYESRSNIVYAGEISKKSVKQREYMMLENEMISNIKFGKKETLAIFAAILEVIRPLTENEKKNKILEILVRSSYATRLAVQGNNEYENYANIVYEMENVENLEAWAYKKFEYIIKAVRTNRGARKSKAVQEALDYIENHYQEEISLKEVADYVGVTPQHFSKIFKEEIGKNYVEWVTNFRVDMAKKYLNGEDRNIKEVCYLVGYKDPNYFSRIFKKNVGVSPTEYINDDK